MKNNFIITVLLMFMSVSKSYPQLKAPEFIGIQFNTKSTIIVNEVSSGKEHIIWGQFLSLLPYRRINTDSVLLNSNNNAVVTYEINEPSPVLLFAGKNLRFNLFLVPNDTLFITLNLADSSMILHNIKFKGKYAAINEYQIKREEEITNQVDNKRRILWNSNLPLTAYIDSLDAISKIELNYLINYNKKNALPEWYLKYEEAKINYSNALFKMNLPSFREFVSNKKIEIPNNYYDFLNKIKINNKDALFSEDYYNFLSAYFNTMFVPKKVNIMKSTNRITESLPIELRIADSLLTGEVKDIYKCFEISKYIITEGNTLFADRIIGEQWDKISNAKYLIYLGGFLNNTLLLSQGEKAPNFYLPDQKEEYKSLNDYKGKVVLLNFWFPDCPYCRKEIPFEKKLVDEFKNKGFCLINICVETPKNEWLKSLRQLNVEGINLFASNDWENILSKIYDINICPHYTLINKDGTIYSNSPKHPSECISDDISKLLSK